MRQTLGMIMMVVGAIATAFFLYLPGDAQSGFEGISYLLSAPFIIGSLALTVVGFIIYNR